MAKRFFLWDTAVISAIVLLLLFLASEYELLRWSGLSRGRAEELELAEVVAIALIAGCLMLAALRRMRVGQHEVHLRLLAERHAHKLAFEDPLTGLANRRRFDEALTAAIGAPPGADRVHALLILDLNRFKAINDVYGHPVGDEVLAVVSGRLAGAVRNQEDVVARLGGDEFAIIALHVYGAEEATGIGLRVIEALRAPIKVGQNEHSVGIGVGIALFPHDALNAQEWVRRADVALYRAKTERPSALKFFQDDMDEQVKARARLEAALRHALCAGEITVHYQPQRELDSGKVATFEAIAQWRHSAWGNVPPERFIPVAEECGLIHELGMQILRTACADAKSWPDTISVSINISPMQLHMHDFQAMVERALAEADLSPERLELEITENTLVRDLQAAQHALLGLRAHGVRIALDDFGTGYSSLYHLRNFKVDRIKIDRSFVETMDTEAQSAAIVRALLGLGRGLGIRVTAEGAEGAAPFQADGDAAYEPVSGAALSADEVKAMTLG